jgi:amidase
MAETAVARAVGDTVGAFCSHATHARVGLAGASTGPLSGLTFAVKDVFAIEGVTACCGNPTWLATHAPATRTAGPVVRLLTAGARLAGLTVTDELALSLTGENHHYGAPVNPRAPSRVAGGSSSGSAAAVAAGLVDFALGTDTGGSVRVPASHCGVLGFRPSHRAVSTDGVWPLAPRFDTVSWFARDAGVLAGVGAVLLEAGADAPGPLPRHLLLPSDVEPVMDPGAATAFARGAAALASRLGRSLSEIAVSDQRAPFSSWTAIYLALQNLEAASVHRSWIERERPRFGSLIARRFDRVLDATAAGAALAEAQRRDLVDRLQSLLDGETWLVWPSAPGAAPLRGLPDDTVDEVTGRALTLGALASLAGLPQVSLPLAEVDGCPLGVSLVARRGADRALLAAAVTIQAARPEVSP